MSVKIRLRRMGAKKRPFYRLVVADSRRARDGRFIETLGYYNPCVEPSELKIDGERARHWLSVGAQPSDTVAGLFKRQGLLERTAKAAKPETATRDCDSPRRRDTQKPAPRKRRRNPKRRPGGHGSGRVAHYPQ